MMVLLTVASGYPHQYHAPMDHPTLLRRPNPNPHALPIEDVLPGTVEDYRVTQVGDAWSVVHAPTVREVYAGLGQVASTVLASTRTNMPNPLHSSGERSEQEPFRQLISQSTHSWMCFMKEPAPVGVQCFLGPPVP